MASRLLRLFVVAGVLLGLLGLHSGSIAVAKKKVAKKRSVRMVTVCHVTADDGSGVVIRVADPDDRDVKKKKKKTKKKKATKKKTNKKKKKAAKKKVAKKKVAKKKVATGPVRPHADGGQHGDCELIGSDEDLSPGDHCVCPSDEPDE